MTDGPAVTARTPILDLGARLPDNPRLLKIPR
jgi:hypothetical protein